MQIIILSGGFGTRLYPLTKNLPKALIQINGKPFIEYQLDYLIKKGFKKFHLCLGFKSNLIVDFISKNQKFNQITTFSEDGEKALGTGGSIIKSYNYLDDIFCITYGDTLLPINYKKPISFFNKNNFDMVMTIYKNNKITDKYNILYKKNLIKKYDKGNKINNLNCIDYGFLITKKEVFKKKYSKGMKVDLVEIINKLIIEQKVAGYEVKKPFYEIGNHESLKKTSYFILNSLN